MPKIIFPEGFVWGVATSAYQIEGAWNADGRGESIWDHFAHTPGNVVDASNGDVACDHYHRWRDDIQLLKSYGIKAYRFSIAWPRILPEGRGRINPAGLDFYSRLVDGLLEAGIAPYATLYHWDLPQALQDEGGWPSRSVADAFVNYADVVSRHLGDRVKSWSTHNEPWCASFLSYQVGEHAPGLKNEWTLALRAAHHLLLSHGLAVPAIRANCPGARVGIVLNFVPAEPASRSWHDYNAARWFDGWFNRWFIDPICGRQYPADMVAAYTQAGHLPNGLDYVLDGDYGVIATPIDFLGVNYYNRAVLRDQSAKDNLPVTNHVSSDQTDMNWEVYPEAFYGLLSRLHFDYQIPEIYVMENGASYADGPDNNGMIHDSRRIRFLRDHLAAAHRAIQNGVPLCGYFAWSLMDNFEWAKGYTQRFGIVWVDFETQQRVPKESAAWYRDVIEKNAVLMDNSV